MNDSIAENSFKIENEYQMRMLQNYNKGKDILNKIELIKSNPLDNSNNEQDKNIKEFNSTIKSQIVEESGREENDNMKNFNYVADELNNKIKDMLNKNY